MSKFKLMTEEQKEAIEYVDVLEIPEKCHIKVL